MNIVIVPSHNQSQNIERIVRGYEKQTILPDLLLFVLDRCSDNSLETISTISTSLNLQWIIKTVGENFSAGMTRDFGLDFVKDLPYEMILFTDGDCAPSEKVIEKHLENIKQSSRPLVSCGMRKMEDVEGKLLEDERLDKNWINEFSFTDTNGRIIVSNQLTLSTIFTYSCNLAFNKPAIELCREVNKKLTNDDRVFNSLFDGKWGGEDNLISHILYRTGNWILMCDKDSWVEHIYHEEFPKVDIEKRRMLVESLSRKLSVLILKGEIEGPVQKVYKNYVIKFGFADVMNEIKNTNYIKGLDSQLENYLDYVCEKYDYLKIPLKYFCMNNVKVEYDAGVGCKDFSLSLYKEFLGYLKFYLRNDDIVFEDDVKDFKKLNSENKKKCSYCSLTDK